MTSLTHYLPFKLDQQLSHNSTMMNFSNLHLHRQRFTLLAMFIIAVMITVTSLGELKPLAKIDFFDVAGEGGMTLMTVIWIFFTLASRPAGRVTNLLFIGLTFMHVSMLLDFLDEFLRYPDNLTWITTIESLPAPIGMIIMSWALYQWHQEQNTINNQLRRSERFYREHSLIDFTTGLYSAEYMKNQIKKELSVSKAQHTSFSLVMLDIRQFSYFNSHYGHEHGDSLLSEVAQLIQMNIRDGDLACRYASDRFIVLMPNTDTKTAQEIAQQTKQAIEHLAYKLDNTSHAIYPNIIVCSHQYRGWHSYDEVLADINQHLSLAKQRVDAPHRQLSA